MIKKMILVLLYIGLASCHSNPLNNILNSSKKPSIDVKKYFIADYTSSQHIDKIVDKMINVDWRIETTTTKEELVYFLNEAIMIFNNQLCVSNPYSNIVITDLKIDYTLLTRIESVKQESGIVFFYVFEKQHIDEIHVEIRRIKDKYTILCGVPIPL